jgi:Cys-tRNA(Pro)/Cys-tRNA(Cys) deacylase
MSSHADYERQLQTCITEHAVRAEHLVFANSCHSVAEAAEAAGATAQDFVKTVCMLSKSGQVVAVIVKGDDRADRSAAQNRLAIGKLSIASPAEMLEKTGYPAGGTPPFGFEAHFLVDDRVLDMPVVYAGGGSEFALVRIAPAELLRVNGGTVATVRVVAAAS